jgi:hypothetical protein
MDVPTYVLIKLYIERTAVHFFIGNDFFTSSSIFRAFLQSIYESPVTDSSATKCNGNLINVGSTKQEQLWKALF